MNVKLNLPSLTFGAGAADSRYGLVFGSVLGESNRVLARL